MGIKFVQVCTAGSSFLCYGITKLINKYNCFKYKKLFQKH